MTADDKISAAREALDEGLFPLELYNDPDVHRLELERLFARAWIFVGHETEIPEPGDYARRYIGDDLFIFVRNESGTIEVLFDSCRHQGAKLCRAEQGNTSHFRCPYHGWTYDNSGDLVGVPNRNDAFPKLDVGEHGLVAAPRVDAYHGLVFASIAESGSDLKEYLGGFTWYLDVLFGLPDGGMEVLGEPQRWVAEANWKTAQDNFSADSYHAPHTHRSVSEMRLAGEETHEIASSTERSRRHRHIHVDGHVVSIRGLRDEQVFLNYPESVWPLLSPDGMTDDQYDLGRRTSALSAAMFPNLAFLYHGDATDDPTKNKHTFFTIRQWRPVGPQETEIWSWALAPAKASEAFKERSYKVYLANFGPSGNFEQDDIPIWEGITSVADSQIVRRQNLNLNFQMGAETMGGSEIDEDWEGPGRAIAGDLEAGAQRVFHENWYRYLSDDEPSLVRDPEVVE